MDTKVVKLPSPEHPISITKNPSRVVVTAGGKVLADTSNALTLREAKYPAMQYIPRGDVDMAALVQSTYTTYCPFKGDCAYYSLPEGGEQAADAVWTYEAPFDAVAMIKDHLAFYPDRVEIAEVAA